MGISNKRSQLGVSTFFVQMGQFIDHDLTLTPEEEDECCAEDSIGRPWVYSDDWCVGPQVEEDVRQAWAWGGNFCPNQLDLSPGLLSFGYVNLEKILSNYEIYFSNMWQI